MEPEVQTTRRRIPRRLAWIILGVILATVGVMVVVGLASGDESSEVDSVVASRFVTSSTTTTTAPTTTTAASKITWQYPHTSSFEVSTPDGYTGRIVLERGDLLPASVVAGSIPSVCPLDRAKDVVAPFRVTVINTTTSFSTKTQASIAASAARVENRRELGLRAVVAYSDGPTCEEQRGFGNLSLLIGPSTTLPPDGRVQVTGWFLVSEFYSPATPDGDRESLRHVVLIVGAVPPFKVNAATHAIRQDYPVDTTAWLVPLDPTSDGGCSVRGSCPP